MSPRGSASHLVLLGVGLLLALYGLHKHGVFASPPVLAYGERLDPVVITAPDQQSLELSRGVWHFILSGSTHDFALIKYLAQLLENPTLRAASLQPVVLIDGHHEEVKDFELRSFLSFPVHALHSFRHQDLISLGLEGHERAYALVSPDLEVVFASSYLQPNDLRLLLEKHLGFGAPNHPGALEPGDPFPTLELKKIAGPPLDGGPTPPDRLWILFTAQCVSCSLGNQIEGLAAAQALLQDLGRTTTLDVGVIFSSAFEQAELAELLAYLDLTQLPVYLASSPLYGLEDPYLRSSLHGSDVLVARLDPNGAIEEIESFSSFLGSLSASQPGGPR
jgi:hypothetical protein